jgi:hypothetical protein
MQVVVNPTGNPARQLAKLDQLRAAGVISPEQYAQARALLGG